MVEMSKDLVLGETVSAEVIQIYVTTRNEDLTEGRGRVVDHTYHFTRAEAQIATSHIDVMGSDGKVEERLALRLRDGRIFLAPKRIIIAESAEAKARLREQALAKLSLAERAALFG